MAVARILFRADFSFLKIRFVSVALFVLQNDGSWVERRAQFWLPEADLTQTWLVYADRHRVVTKAKVSSFTGQVVNKCEFKWCSRFQLFRFKNKLSFSFFLSFFFYDIDFFAKKEVLLSALIYLQVPICLFVNNKLSARKWSLRICWAYPLRSSVRIILPE